MSASPVEFVRHIRDETDYLARQSRNLSKKDFSIDFDIVWDVITNKIPALQHELEKIIKMEAG